MITLFHGKNTYLSRKKANEKIAQAKEALTKKDIAFEARIFDASSHPAEGIISEIETPSLFSQQKVLLIKRMSQSPEKEDLYEYVIQNAKRLQKNKETNIIIWEDTKLPANLRIMKALKEESAIDESPELNKRTFRTWAKEAVAEGKLSFSGNALFLLSERTNYDTERFSKELDKISLLQKDVITEQDVEQLCPDTLEHTIWEMIDAINDNDTSLAEKKLSRILRQGNDPQFVLLMLTRNVRIILLTKIMLEQGASTSDIARKIKCPPFTINAIRKKAYETSISRITRIYDKLANIDYSGKTGQLDIALALNILLSVI